MVIPACPAGAVRYVADSQAPLGGRTLIAQELCNEYQQCVSVCCGHAIVVVE